MTNKMVDGVIMPLTTEEQAAYDSRQAEYAAALPSRLLAALAARRYTVQNGGTTVAGIPLKTDVESRSALLTAYVVAGANPSYTVNWKGADGQFVALTSSQIISVGNAVLAFVQKCFDTESTITAAIGDYTTEDQIVTAFNQAIAN